MYSQCVVSNRTMVLLSIVNALSLVRWPNEGMAWDRRGFNTLPTAHYTAFKIAMSLHCRKANVWKVKRRKRIQHHMQTFREELNVIPQLNSSKPSAQSSLKSHTLSLATHSPCDPHANIPLGQVFGGTVGAGVVTEGIVVFCLGSSPRM